ncbi:hypothetical protein Q7V65_07020, partial [Streptococcus suis]|nr:hypothetical protein [Streptococcus suis]
DYNRKKKWKLKALAATSIAGGFLVFLYEKNWLEAIIRKNLVKQGLSIVFDASCRLLVPELTGINRTQIP